MDKTRFTCRFNDVQKAAFPLLCLAIALLTGGDQSLLALKKQALDNDIRLMATVTGPQSGIFDIDERVLKAMAQVPRHRYLAPQNELFAYMNVALPATTHRESIPEPFITAMMIHLLHPEKHEKILEIGPNAGFDAAVLARLAGTVYSVNQTDNSSAAITKTGNIVKKDSGPALGWAEQGPYDAILVRAALPAPPLALLKQLKPGGRIVLPVGASGETQRLTVYTLENGGLSEHPAVFVKMPQLLTGTEI